MENTQHTVMLKKIKEILIMLPDLMLLSTLNGSNYLCLELNFMVQKVFEPFKFDCIINRDYYMGFSLSPDLSARDSNIGPRACPRSDIGRGLIDRVMTKTPCYDLFII